ncbi:MAG: PA2169 family four-helix-bundle protein [Planctomycetales bacterium]|nr:PA2169 family four-helix-bundle protein [Planctomycetales bacterium]
MTLETKHDLNPETIDGVQKLIRYNIDAEKGFREAADQIEDARLSALFSEIADQRSALALELQGYVAWNDEEPVDEGSALGAVHRAWLKVRALLNGGDAYAILAEAERGEDHIKDAYEEVLKETAGSAMNDVFQHQYALVKAGHDQIRDLRDAHKED